MKSRGFAKALLFTGMVAGLLMACGTTAAGSDEEGRRVLCPDGRDPVGDLGITGMKMKGALTIDPDAGEYVWSFEAEPKISDIDPNGPSKGILKPGDVIVAIDGLAITTRRGGKRFAALVPGEPVQLTIRRGWRTLQKTVNPVAVCPGDHPLHPLSRDIDFTRIKLERLRKRLEDLAVIADVPKLPDLPQLPELEGFAEFPELDFKPRAWFGMAISCDGCTINTGKGGESARWQFDNPPKIHSVEPGGPAEQAGLREGDVLTHVDGIPIDTRRGGKRFSSIEPGETVTWTIKRGNQRQTIEMFALEHPEPEPAPEIGLASGDSPLRFSGMLGDTDIEVRGERSVDVTRDEDAGVIVIRTRDAVIRLRLTK